MASSGRNVLLLTFAMTIMCVGLHGNNIDNFGFLCYFIIKGCFVLGIQNEPDSLEEIMQQ